MTFSERINDLFKRQRWADARRLLQKHSTAIRTTTGS